MTKISPFHEKFYVAKKNNAFVVFANTDRFSILPEADAVASGYGFYHDDTRLIRHMTFKVIRDGVEHKVTTTQGHLPDGEHWWRLKGDQGWEIEHRAFVQNDIFYHSFCQVAGPEADLAIHIDLIACFEDVFEVRRFIDTWPRQFDIQQDPRNLCLTHHGKDGQDRRLLLSADQDITWGTVGVDKITLSFPLSGMNKTTLTLQGARSQSGEIKNITAIPDYQTAMTDLRHEYEVFKGRFNIPAALSERMQNWVSQAMMDVFQLQGRVDGYPCFHAGIPWFAAMFGRDGLIAAEQLLDLAPDFAAQTLRALGRYAAEGYNSAFDAQPGKIPHEMRFGERARLGHVPFGHYYGSIDATPLYISLMQRYVERTGDRALLQELSGVVTGAIQWLETELSNGKFLTYASNQKDEGPYGLTEKGWKDGAPVIRSDGKLASHPVALCEVQGYAYKALGAAASLLTMLDIGDDARIAALRDRAETLKKDFNESFWCEGPALYALALDADGELCSIETSNPGHLLRTGIVDSEDRIAAVARSLSNPEKLFSGWGVRTLSATSPFFKPESYQLGGVWPHDTCEALRGLLAVGQIDAARVIFNGLQDLASVCHYRLPELVTGYQRVGDEFSIYANSCSPQAWSATIPFALIPHLDVLKG